MQEQITFKLSEEFLRSPGDIISLKTELGLNLKFIEELLLAYHFQSRERVFDVNINESSLELIHSHMAKVQVNYSIGLFNACADVDFTERKSMEILVDIDINKSEAIITGEYLPERDSDEF